MKTSNWIIILVSVLLIFSIGIIKLKQETFKEDIIIKETIIFMEENNLTIYGLTTCPWCKKQFEEFRNYSDELLNKELFIYCDVKPEKCSDIVSVPAWKKNDEIVHVGYLQLNQIEEKFP